MIRDARPPLSGSLPSRVKVTSMTVRRLRLITPGIALLFVLVRVGEASYCGQAGIPFSLEILSNGQPVLGCARPSCFGWNAKGQRAADPAQFYRIGKQTDGFIRASDKKGPVVQNATLFQPQFSVCERSYYSERCSAPNQWVGGILPAAIIKSDNPMRLMCCSYDKLNEATNEDRVPLRSGQAVQGGEVRNTDGRQRSFEYIANIERSFDREGVIYTVTFKEFPCLPEPNGPAGVETDAAKYLIENINAVDSHSAPVPQSNRAAGVPVSARQEVPVFTEQKTFAEQTFDLPHSMPQEDTSVTSVHKSESAPQPKQKSRKYGVPVAQPYEWESADEATKRGSTDARIGTRDDQFKQIVDGGKPAQSSTDQGVERYGPVVQASRFLYAEK
ncbi:Warthog protein [Aphelenchoides avenae]|nr:Warthog protein [Aphelenchus avenae]